ncbi:ribosomal protein S18 [Tothia fuscella]|uniref:Small ribosomal subunit protein bS18m n=1 Tax=Tothia fuscella TaxID=1048955 RepID=A0A9P4NE67_9PEZI|nr:ribosomal protein S18 [Tothia fuscella]
MSLNVLREDIKRQMPRRWRSGDVYAPHDLGSVEASKWKTIQRRPEKDVFDMLGTHPIKHYKNLKMMSEFVTDTGRIKGSRETGLRPRNQRRVAKAVRRAIGIGLMPSVYIHPEIQATKLNISRHGY